MIWDTERNINLDARNPTVRNRTEQEKHFIFIITSKYEYVEDVT